MMARLATVTSNKAQMSRGLPQGAPESPVIFTMIMELVLRDLIKSWISRKLAWRLDNFTLAAICFADDVVLIAVSVSAAETMVSEVIEKLKEVGLTVGAQKTHWTSFFRRLWTKTSWWTDRECKTCDRTQNSSSQQMSSEMETCVEFTMAPQIVAVEHRKNYDVAGLPLELECQNDGQGTERDKIASWSARMVANVVGVKRPDGSRCNMNVLVAIRDRMLSWAGHVARMDYKEICAKALRWKLEAVFELWKESCTDGPLCLGDPCAFRTVGTDAGAYVLAVKGYGREWVGVHLVPLLSMSSQVGLCSDVLLVQVLVMIGRVRMARDIDVDVAAGAEMPRSFGSVRRAECPFRDVARKC